MARSRVRSAGRRRERPLSHWPFVSACGLLLAAAALPATLRAAEASAPIAGSAPRYTPGAELPFGNSGIFRSLVPSPVLESQSAVEYSELIQRAREDGSLQPATDAHVERVRAIVLRLAPFASKWSDRVKDWRWEVNVVRSQRIGMVCLPGGKILVYAGLLDRIRLRDDELGVLFGHEIAHALREQVRERLDAQQVLQLGASPMPRLFGVAELGETTGTASGTGTAFASIRYDATDETEADVIGGDIAARAGFDPRAAVPLWDKLAAATRRDKANGFVHAHPYSEARRLDIIKRLPDMLALFAKARGVAFKELPDYRGMTATPSGSSNIRR
jgi:Zn-dependent protease with chaperone function